MRVPLALARALVFLVARPIGPPVPVRLQRLWLEAMSTGGVLPRGTTVERLEVGGRPAERIVPPGADESRAVLMLHGGAFVIGSPRVVEAQTTIATAVEEQNVSTAQAQEAIVAGV